MSITITLDNQSEVHYHQRSIDFEGAEPLLIAHRNYSYGGKHFLPTYAGVRWEHGEDIQRIRVFGTVLRADGKPSKNRTDVVYETPASPRWDNEAYPQAPAWLLELFGIEAPE